MILSTKEKQPCTIGGVEYLFRTPDVYDPARARRALTRQRVRRPTSLEFRIMALSGVRAMADAVNDPDEGRRQAAIVEEWFELLVETDEDKLDEPDLDTRRQMVKQAEEERKARQEEIYPLFTAIEANLERHWQPYAELLADRIYWDDVSRIEIVRLLLCEIDGKSVPVDAEGFLTHEAYQRIPPEHRLALATFAFRLMTPDETARKN